VGHGGVLQKTTDGRMFSSVGASVGTQNIYSLTYNLDDDCMFLVTSSGSLRRLRCADDQVETVGSPGGTLFAVHYRPQDLSARLWVGGTNRLLYTDDVASGSPTWTACTVDGAPVASGTIGGIAHAGASLVGVASSVLNGGSNYTAGSVDGGEGFTSRDPNPGNRGNRAAASTSRLVVVGRNSNQGVIASSQDGGTWSVVSSPPDRVNDVKARPGTLSMVAVGESNVIRRSLDGGETWAEPTTLPSAQVWKCVVPGFVDGEWFAYSNSTDVGARSTDDGDTWEDIPLSGAGWGTLNDAALR
jgi:hypothetical protein